MACVGPVWVLKHEGYPQVPKPPLAGGPLSVSIELVAFLVKQLRTVLGRRHRPQQRLVLAKQCLNCKLQIGASPEQIASIGCQTS